MLPRESERGANADTVYICCRPPLLSFAPIAIIPTHLSRQSSLSSSTLTLSMISMSARCFSDRIMMQKETKRCFPPLDIAVEPGDREARRTEMTVGLGDGAQREERELVFNQSLCPVTREKRKMEERWERWKKEKKDER